MYRKGDKYLRKAGRTYFFILDPGNPEGKFFKTIQTYCNGLINTTGGLVVFGVNCTEKVNGFRISRESEDRYKCSFDSAIRQMRPTIHPHQYRFDVLYLQSNAHLALFEIRISAGDPAEIYENTYKEMFIVKEKSLYGPLFPCEITQIVLQKYKEEISSIMEGAPTTTQSSDQQKQEHEQEQEQQIKPPEKKTKVQIERITYP